MDELQLSFVQSKEFTEQFMRDMREQQEKLISRMDARDKEAEQRVLEADKKVDQAAQAVNRLEAENHA